MALPAQSPVPIVGRLAGRVAIVTGGAGGIGAATCARLAAEGAVVAVADVPGSAVDAVVAGLPVGAFGVPVDVTSIRSIQEMVDRVVDRAGAPQILVNNAGIYDLQPFLETSPDRYDRLFAVNTRGMFFTLQAVGRVMAAGSGGAVVNVSSQAGRRGERASAVYAATKAAVISLTQSAALALVDRGIRVNAVAPGIVDTPMWDTVDRLHAQTLGVPPGATVAAAVAGIPALRWADPAEVASVIAFLAGDDSGYVLGQTLNVDGGNVLS